MRIRAVTYFVNIDPDSGAQADTVEEAGHLVRQARAALESAGVPVQSTRLATQPLSLLSAGPLEVASELWPPCAAAGFDYLSLGPVLADGPAPGASGAGVSEQDLSRLDLIPDLIRANESIFAGVLVAHRDQGVHLGAIRRTARIIREIAHTTELGFGNLQLAMLANVGPLTPFFPAAYHDGGPPALAIATEAADLAVTAFAQAGSLREAQTRLVVAVEAAAGQIAELVGPLAQRHDTRFAGIDFTLAPFPEEARSIGAAVERLGVDRFGAPGTLFVSWLLTDCVRRARYPRCGFNGLMLPVLEDATLAKRSQERLFTINDLLICSAVCGTGLDTVPLPGDVSEEELAGILLDVAALALRLDKPLTARLMPIPGARAGDMTEFDFAYFANGRVLDVKGFGSPGLFARGEWLAM
jgi:uncharacterized protein (UPF0210 family)